MKDAILDLIHELSHFISKENFNLYEDFSILRFVKKTISGEGGEVNAFVQECTIGKELFGGRKVSSQCKNILDRKYLFSKKLAKKEFYKLGSYYEDFMKYLDKYLLKQKEFNMVSDEEEKLISSAWDVPYPIAAFLEYEEMMGKVCINNERRFKYFTLNTRMGLNEVSYSKAKRLYIYCHKFL